MKGRACCLTCIALILLVSLTACAAQVTWAKYVSQDGSFSFHYPKGWQVKENESVIVLEGEDSGEDVYFFALPYEHTWSAEEHARFMLSALQAENPGLEAYGWESDSESETVLFNLVYGGGAHSYDGLGLVIKDSDSRQALWLHYFAPSENYSQSLGAYILQGFLGSIASGSTSKPPDEGQVSSLGEDDERAERILKNANAFMFILEFALGSPLSLSEEYMVPNELQRSWALRSAAELAQYDDYPDMVSIVMHIDDQHRLADIQQTLAASVLEWIDETDPGDPIVRMIRTHMIEDDKILVDGDPSLTELIASAYGELMACAELLQRDPDARPDSIDEDTVDEIKGRLADVWLQMSREERELSETVPTVWSTLRHSLTHGDNSDQESARRIVVKLAPDRPYQSQDTEGAPLSMFQHTMMMQAQQATFNHWMFCQGYRRTPFGY
jgi:hypothetical protein